MRLALVGDAPSGANFRAEVGGLTKPIELMYIRLDELATSQK
jgi:hypothetical protein